MPIPGPPLGQPLFTADDLGNVLGGTVTDAKSATIERVVWGWLMDRLGLDTRPQPVPDNLFSWAVELGAIFHENPAGLSAKQLGPGREEFSAERRDEILETAWFATPTSAGRPRANFPPAQRYPDPARVYGSPYGYPEPY